MNAETFDPKPRLVFLHASHSYLLNHGRYKEQSHKQRNKQVYDNHRRKVLQIQT